MERGTLAFGLAIILLSGALAGCTGEEPETGESSPGIVVPRSSPPVFDLDFRTASDLLNLSESISRNISQHDRENVSGLALSAHRNALVHARQEITNGSFPRALHFAWESLWRTLELESRIRLRTDAEMHASNLENVTTLKTALDGLAQAINETRAEGKLAWGHLLRVEGDLVRAYFDYQTFVDTVHEAPSDQRDLHTLRLDASSNAAWAWMRVAYVRQELLHAKEAVREGEPVHLGAINEATVARAVAEASEAIRDLPTTPEGNATIVSPYIRAARTMPAVVRIAQDLAWPEAVFETALEQAAFARIARFQSEGRTPTNEQFNATWESMLANVTDPVDAWWFYYAAAYRDDYVTAQENDLPEGPFFLIAAWRTAEQLGRMRAAREAAFGASE